MNFQFISTFSFLWSLKLIWWSNWVYLSTCYNLLYFKFNSSRENLSFISYVIFSESVNWSVFNSKRSTPKLISSSLLNTNLSSSFPAEHLHFGVPPTLYICHITMFGNETNHSVILASKLGIFFTLCLLLCSTSNQSPHPIKSASHFSHWFAQFLDPGTALIQPLNTFLLLHCSRFITLLPAITTVPTTHTTLSFPARLHFQSVLQLPGFSS